MNGLNDNGEDAYELVAQLGEALDGLMNYVPPFTATDLEVRYVRKQRAKDALKAFTEFARGLP